ncbi:MAG: hypothetical protein M5U14_00460 [Acidimicrobiia bacterium]|nr:hypothetical protein [Acidimicrobiia bacterium]
MVPTPIQAGASSRRLSTSPLAARHGSAGATAMRNRMTRPSGTVIRSKYGSPTLSWRSWSTSATIGKTVPSSTTKANPAKARLLARNAASRDTGESMRPGARSRSPRQATRATPVAVTTPRKVSSHGPMADSEKACTELTTPERVRKVPRIVRQKVAITSDRFQTRSMPRRSWTITECRKAVPVSQGSSDAFSTGSQAQNPPQPSTS